MGDWNQVKWAEAWQIVAAMELDEEPRPPEGVAPRSHFQSLRERSQLDRAVCYLGHALPRYEAVAWAAHLLEVRARSKRLPAMDQQALDRTFRWLEEPTDEYRRAAFVAAEAAGTGSPERLLAMAVYMSGGSIAPSDLPAVNPPQEVCGRIAAAAVLIDAYRSNDPATALAAALDAGDKIAAKGAQTGSRS